MGCYVRNDWEQFAVVYENTKKKKMMSGSQKTAMLFFLFISWESVTFF